jgi:hypothetical protein
VEVNRIGIWFRSRFVFVALGIGKARFCEGIVNILSLAEADQATINTPLLTTELSRLLRTSTSKLVYSDSKSSAKD